MPIGAKIGKHDGYSKISGSKLKCNWMVIFVTVVFMARLSMYNILNKITDVHFCIFERYVNKVNTQYIFLFLKELLFRS